VQLHPPDVMAGSATMQRLLGRLPASCQYGAGLFGGLASLAGWRSIVDRMAAAVA
jgi:hypothetical protein